jgi:tripartite-type tricarboxylate transporter receptor subunit TctC
VGNVVAFKDPGYKPEDFTPIGVMGQSYYGLMINAKVPARNVAELVAYAKANPGKLSYGGLGPGAGSTLSAERFKQAAGLDILGVPFKGGDPTTAALLAGDIQIYFATLSTVKARMKTPQIRVLGVTAVQRSAVIPDVATFKELGYPTVLASLWNAVFVPAATPNAMSQRLRDAFAKAAASDEMKAMVENQGYEPYNGTLEQFAAGMKTELAQLIEDYKRLNIKMLE